MAVAAVTAPLPQAGEYARDARWARLAAIVIDTFFFSVIAAAVNGVYGVSTITSGYVTASGGVYSTTTAVPAPVLSLLALLYFFVGEAVFGATPGKQLMRVRVVRLDGRPLATRDVVIRNAMRLIDFLPVLYLLGGLFVVFSPGAQRLGDRAAGTTVVYRHHAPRRTDSGTARIFLAAALAFAVVFSIAFDYFGRPPLVIQGLYNEHSLLEFDVRSYTLGPPTWGAGTVTYPIKFATATKSCTGTMTLEWENFGWQPAGANYQCPPS